MSFLSGTIQLNDIHMRQDSANKLINSFGIPISLKVGLISKVNISFSVINFWASPLDLEIDEAYIILGPSLFLRSNNDSFIDEAEDDLLNTSYDPTNSFNIFEHEMKIKGNAVQINNQV
jgi:hypothetical protein